MTDPTPTPPATPPGPTPATPPAPPTPELGATTETELFHTPTSAEEGVQPARLRRSPGAGVGVALGRAGLALGAAAAAAALAAGVLLIPSPSITAAVPAVPVTPERADQALVCAGGALGLTRGADPQLTVVADPRRVATGAGLVESTATASDAVDGAATVVTLPREAPGDLLAAAESLRPRTADVSGLAAAECIAPARTAWLVGGATTVGRTTWVVLTNADAVDAVVDLALWGANGPIEALGTTGIIVAPGEQRIVPLAGLAVDEASPVVRVTSTGGSVAATLQTSIVRGLDPDGVSVITPVAAPATSHVIPALPVIGLETALERFSVDGGADALTAVRMLAPGDTSAEVTVTLVPQQGGLGLSTQATLAPGVVLDLPFTELADGEYAVVVEASEPIVVAGRTSVAAAADGAGPDGAASADVEWFSPAAALAAGSEGVVAVAPVPGGVTAAVHLLAPAGAEVELDGVAVSVPPGAVVVVPAASDAGLRIRTSAALHVSVTYRGEGLLAGSRAAPPPAASGAVLVLPN